jgi:hypothetical protein
MSSLDKSVDDIELSDMHNSFTRDFKSLRKYRQRFSGPKSSRCKSSLLAEFPINVLAARVMVH